MKKSLNVHLPVIAAICLLAVSCAKESLSEKPLSPEPSETVTFTATLGSPLTKTYLNGVRVNWEMTDSVGLWYGTLGSSMSKEAYFVYSIDESDSRIATLRGFASPSSSYIAVYPLSSAESCSADGTVTVDFPVSQSIKQGSFGHNSNVAVACSSTTDLQFKNIGGLVAIKVEYAGGRIIKEIRLTGTSAMSGEVEMTQSSFPGISQINDANNFICLDCGDGLEDYDGLFGSGETFGEDTGEWGTKAGMSKETKSGGYAGPGQTFYLVSLPGSHTGFVLTFVDSEGKTAVAKSTYAFTINRNSNTVIADISAPADPDRWKTDAQVYINEVDCSNKKIELYNPNTEAVDLSGWLLSKDEHRWAFPVGSTIAAGGYLVVTCKQSDCSSGPTFGISGSKGFDLKLSNGSLVDRIDNLTSVTTIADGETYGRRTDGDDDWVVFSTGTIYESGVCDGDNSKGTVKTAVGVVLNEINGNTKYVELYNVSDQAVDITGWTLSKDGKVVWTASVASQCSITAGAYLTIDFVKKSTDPTQAASGLSAGKNLKVELKDNNGSSIDLFTRGEEGTAGWGESDLPENTAASFSRVPNGTGVWKYATPTKNAENGSKTGTIEQYPAANGVLVLNELDGNNKFIELYNTSSDYSISLEDVTIYKDDEPDPIWTGSPGYSIAPGGFVLLYSTDVKSFHTDHDSGLFFSSGLSPKKTLKIEIKNAPASGAPVTLDTFTRGASPWGSKISEQSDSFGRTPDGTGDWKLIDSTPGTANGASKGDIPQ